MKLVKLCFFGPSGSGKTTAYKIAEDYLRSHDYQVFRCDVARTLRRAQVALSEIFALGSPGNPDEPEKFVQDGKLLGFLAQHYQNALTEIVRKQYDQLLADKWPKCAIINTDCRNNFYPFFDQRHFIFVRLNIEEDLLNKRRALRGDRTSFDHHAVIEQINEIQAHHNLDNNGDLDNLKIGIIKVIKKYVC